MLLLRLVGAALQFAVEFEMGARCPACESRQIMRAEAGERQIGIGAGLAEDCLVAFEPQDLVGKEIGVGEPVAQALRNGPEVLADHHASRREAFLSHHRHQRIDREAHIGAVLAFGPMRYPELPLQAQHMIDAQHA